MLEWLTSTSIQRSQAGLEELLLGLKAGSYIYLAQSRSDEQGGTDVFSVNSSRLSPIAIRLLLKRLNDFRNGNGLLFTESSTHDLQTDRHSFDEIQVILVVVELV